MIDRKDGAFLNFPHFVSLGGRRSNGAALLALVVCLGGCTPHSASSPPEDSLTSGRIRVDCAPEAWGVVLRQQASFQRLYPEARLDLQQSPSRDAVQSLFEARCDLAVITRELQPEERSAALRGGLELEGFRFARDAVVAIVNESNTVENMTIEQLRAVYGGRATDWAAFGGARRRVTPVLQPPTSDVTAFFAQEVMRDEPFGGKMEYASGDSAVVAYVRGHADAIGFVTLGGLGPGVRALRLATIAGLPYWKPDLEAVYKGDYPLTRYFNFYVRTDGPRVAHGFITYATSRDGQQEVRDSGLVPTSVPVRFVRRSPMMSTH